MPDDGDFRIEILLQDPLDTADVYVVYQGQRRICAFQEWPKAWTRPSFR